MSIKARQKKRNEKGRSATVVAVGESIVKKVKGWELSTKDDLFVARSFPGAKRNLWNCILSPH